jgi:hypothetical protein
LLPLRHCSREPPTAARRLRSAVPGLLVWLDPQTIHELVEAAEQIDDRHELEDALIVQPQLPHRGSVDLQSIGAGVHRRDGDGDDLLGQATDLPEPNMTALTFRQLASR